MRMMAFEKCNELERKTKKKHLAEFTTCVLAIPSYTFTSPAVHPEPRFADKPGINALLKSK